MSAVLVEVVQEVVPASVGGDLFRGRGLDLDHVTAQEGGGVKHLMHQAVKPRIISCPLLKKLK